MNSLQKVRLAQEYSQSLFENAKRIRGVDEDNEEIGSDVDLETAAELVVNQQRKHRLLHQPEQSPIVEVAEKLVGKIVAVFCEKLENQPVYFALVFAVQRDEKDGAELFGRYLQKTTKTSKYFNISEEIMCEFLSVCSPVPFHYDFKKNMYTIETTEQKVRKMFLQKNNN